MSLTPSFEHMVIRPVRPSDAERVRELRLMSLSLAPLAFGVDVAEESARDASFWQARSTPDENQCTIVADDGATLWGTAVIRRDPRRKIRHTASVHGVFVHPLARRHQLATRLVEGAMSWAAEHEVTTVTLSVVSTNAAALHSYLRAGFAIYGMQPDALRLDGKSYDEMLLYRRSRIYAELS